MRFIMFYFLFFYSLISYSQTTSRPKLVVGIVVDQMRYDYLYRYESKYGKDGLKRLMNKGAVCENTQIPYIPTYTAPGHSSIYSGSVPAINGIIGNDWFVRANNRNTYCTFDEKVISVGGSGKVGKHSPHNLWVTTITDELRLAQNFRNKTIGIAIKDRGAILPAGHSANAAFWLDQKEGNWISSTYYMKDLPKWVADFNAKKLADKYLKNEWTPHLELHEYCESTADDKWYEYTYDGEEKPVFPHKVNEMTKKGYEVLRATPWGNSFTAEFAKAAVVGEQLGKSDFTDFLAVSFSSTDYIGHQFGPNSIEMQDTYIRFDKELADFLKFLDQEVGKGQYLLFLTADHGAAHAKGFLDEHNIPSSVFYHDTLKNKLNSELAVKFGKDYQANAFINFQLYFNDNVSYAEPALRASIYQYSRDFFLKDNDVLKVVDLRNLSNESINAKEKEILQNGYLEKRSGDIQVVFKSAILEEFPKGTTHGTGYNYDTHIPLLWYGWGIKPQLVSSPTFMTDIAPTLANLLKIQEPSGSIGKAIEAICNKRK